jgi:hypothetical protein
MFEGLLCWKCLLANYGFQSPTIEVGNQKQPFFSIFFGLRGVRVANAKTKEATAIGTFGIEFAAYSPPLERLKGKHSPRHRSVEKNVSFAATTAAHQIRQHHP